MRARAIPAAFLLCALAAAPAAAQQTVVQRSLDVTGSAPQVCTLQLDNQRIEGLVNFVGAEGDTLRVVELTDPATLMVREARATVVFGAVCNFPHRVRLESQENGMWPIAGPLAAPTNEFVTALPYLVTLDWADRVGVLAADAKVRRAQNWQADIDDPAEGELRLTIELDRGASNTRVGAPVLAGAYGDTLRIFLEPR